MKINVNTGTVKEYIQNIQELSESINKVKVIFQRPDLFCQINISKEPSDEVIKAILLRTKEFITVENMNVISKEVNWNLEISTVHLTIKTDDGEGIEHEYYAKYFKTFDASNKSDENIEAYKKWYEVGK